MPLAFVAAAAAAAAAAVVVVVVVVVVVALLLFAPLLYECYCALRSSGGLIGPL